MRIVGTNHSGYANQRNISGLSIEGYKVIRARNALRLPNYLYFRAAGKMHRYLGNLHWDAGFANCDLLHFFNGISLGNRPWVSTFETFLPRWLAYGKGNKEWGLKLLAKPSCKQLIALSECSKEIQLDFMSEFPELKDAISAKISVIHPPQIPLVDKDFEKPSLQNGIKMVLVGADFFRKGGLETLWAVTDLLKKGANLQLEIISSLEIGDYASQASSKEKAKAIELIQSFPRNVHWHQNLPNSEVLEHFRQAHIGLLPTWADTYGYSALEAMATACPVIATNVRALPEIISNERGWLIEVPKDDWGNAVLATETQRAEFSSQLRAKIYGILESILNENDQIQAKAASALKYIESHHSPEIAAQKTKVIYDQALS